MSPDTSPLDLDSAGHPSVESLADSLENLLTADDTAALDAHLADCQECRETRASLAEISSLLGRTEVSELPADIGLRLDAALADEAAGAGFRLPQGGPSAPGRPPRTATTRPPRSPASRRRWRRAVLGAAALSVVGLVVSTAVQQRNVSGAGATANSGRAGTVAGASEPKALGRAAELTDANLPEQVQNLLPGSSSNGTGQSPRAAGPDASTAPQATSATASGSVVSTPGCVLTATGRTDEKPLAVASTSYRDTPVFLVVYSDPAATPPAVDAYVVAASCSPSGGLLLHRTVPAR